MDKLLVSIVILAFDNLQALLRTVESIYHNTDYENFEIIVAQNPCGTDDEARITEQCIIWHGNWRNFKWVKNDKNLYHGKGTMGGVKIADGELILLCNDDLFVPARQSDWLTKLVDFITDEERKNVATVTPAMYYPKETVYWVGKTDEDAPYHDHLHTPKGDSRIPRAPVKVVYNNMAACLTWRWLLDKVPLGQSCPHYGSDSEYAHRIRDEISPDWEHWCVPAAQIYHYNIFNLRVNHGQDKVIDG